MYTKVGKHEGSFQVIIEKKSDFFKHEKEVVSLLEKPNQEKKYTMSIVLKGVLVFLGLVLGVLIILFYSRKIRSGCFHDLSPSEKELL